MAPPIIITRQLRCLTDNFSKTSTSLCGILEDNSIRFFKMQVVSGIFFVFFTFFVSSTFCSLLFLLLSAIFPAISLHFLKRWQPSLPLSVAYALTTPQNSSDLPTENLFQTKSCLHHAYVRSVRTVPAALYSV